MEFHRSLQLYTDGASRGNPGDAGIGVIIKKGDAVIAAVSEYIGSTTNNVAEYTALIRGLREVQKIFQTIKTVIKTDRVDVFLDSELIVKQLNGTYKVRSPHLIPLWKEARLLLNSLNCSIRHIPREENFEADKLANDGIDAKVGRVAAPLKA